MMDLIVATRISRYTLLVPPYFCSDVGTLWNQQREEKPGSVVEGNARENDVLVRAPKKERDD